MIYLRDFPTVCDSLTHELLDKYDPESLDYLPSDIECLEGYQLHYLCFAFLEDCKEDKENSGLVDHIYSESLEHDDFPDELRKLREHRNCSVAMANCNFREFAERAVNQAIYPYLDELLTQLDVHLAEVSDEINCE